MSRVFLEENFQLGLYLVVLLKKYVIVVSKVTTENLKILIKHLKLA